MKDSTLFKNRFTLLEMLIVMAIIALLAALLFPTINVISKKVRSMNGLSRAKTLKQAISTYITTYNRSPFYKFTASTSYSSLTYDRAPANIGKSNLSPVGKNYLYDFLLPFPSHDAKSVDFVNSKGKIKKRSGYCPKYKDDYSSHPYTISPTVINFSDTEYYDRLIRILAAAADKDLMKKYNPKKIVFLNGLDSEGHYFDPWGKRMGLAYDSSGEGQINPYPIWIPFSDHSVNWRQQRNVLQKVLVWSFGPNQINEGGFDSTDGINPDTGKKFDDINTWKE